MKNIIAPLTIGCYLIIAPLLSCYSNKGGHPNIDIDFKNWRLGIIKQLDSMVTEVNLTSSLKISKYEYELIKSEIEYAKENMFMKSFNYSIKHNKIKNWDRMWVVYHFLEGETNTSLSTYIYSGKNDCWGITYSYNKNKYFDIKNRINTSILSLNPTLNGGTGDVIVISEFDSDLNNHKNIIVIGASFWGELAHLTQLYDKAVFD
jgi:hypothetical protein